MKGIIIMRRKSIEPSKVQDLIVAHGDGTVSIPIDPESLKPLYKSGLLTSRGMMYFALRNPELSNLTPPEFADKLSISSATYHKLVRELTDDGLVNATKTVHYSISIPA
jgi:hypothetical protein